jgi:hypothetical protein
MLPRSKGLGFRKLDNRDCLNGPSRHDCAWNPLYAVLGAVLSLSATYCASAPSPA